MEHTLVQPPEVLKLAGHAIRWNVLTSLARSDYRVQDLVERLSLPQNLVSYHLRQLREGRLVTERCSAADERAVFYHLDLERFQALYLAAGETLHPAVTDALTAPLPQDLRGNQASLRVLFLCTENITCALHGSLSATVTMGGSRALRTVWGATSRRRAG